MSLRILLRSKSATVAYSDQMTPPEYVEFMRERLILLRELLSDSGSIYLHIDNKMGHYIKVVMDEIFGVNNFKNDISRIKSNPKNFTRKAYGNQKDMVLFFAKSKPIPGLKPGAFGLLHAWLTDSVYTDGYVIPS
ncbi:hypothetical protein EOM33_06585, partial [Candidatus Saccharibacteria bacterium]|nr:hypothetical protein [Candidatus Saccharibacteria bacterium]